MAVNVQTVLDDRIAQYISRMTAQRHTTEATVVRGLIEAGHEETVRQLHARYQRGELTFRAIAAELGLMAGACAPLSRDPSIPAMAFALYVAYTNRNAADGTCRGGGEHARHGVRASCIPRDDGPYSLAGGVTCGCGGARVDLRGAQPDEIWPVVRTPVAASLERGG